MFDRVLKEVTQGGQLAPNLPLKKSQFDWGNCGLVVRSGIKLEVAGLFGLCNSCE